jgi:iron complex transport system ATP-binding protein
MRMPARIMGQVSVEMSESAETAEHHREPAVSVDGLSMSTSRGPVYTDVTAEVPEGGLLVLRGAEGSGKTCLLLSIAGRMRPSSGTASVRGFDTQRQGRKVRTLVGLAHVHGVTDLESNLSVAEHIAERLITTQPWYKPWISRSEVTREIDKLREVVVSAMAILRESGIPGFRPADVLDADFVLSVSESTYVSELTPLQQFFLQLALTSMDHTPVVAVDDIDLLRDPHDRTIAWLGVLLYRREGVFTDERRTFVVTCADDAQLNELCSRVPDLAEDVLTLDISRSPD